MAVEKPNPVAIGDPIGPDGRPSPTGDQKYRALVEALPALIVITSAAGDIDEISASYAEYTGLSLEEAKDWQAHQVIHPDDVAQSLDRWGQALASGERMQNEMRLPATTASTDGILSKPSHCAKNQLTNRAGSPSVSISKTGNGPRSTNGTWRT